MARGRQSSPILEVRPGEQARLVKTVKIQLRWAAAQPQQDRRLPSVGDTLKASASFGLIYGGDQGNLAPGSLSTGSPASRTPPHGDGSMYSQANVRAGKVLRSPLQAMPSVIVDTEKVMREADGPIEMSALTLLSGGKVFAPGCASKNWTVRAGEEPEEHKRHVGKLHIPPSR